MSFYCAKSNCCSQEMVKFVQTEEVVSAPRSSLFRAGMLVHDKLDLWTCSKFSSSLQLAVLSGFSNDQAVKLRYDLSLHSFANVLHESVKAFFLV